MKDIPTHILENWMEDHIYGGPRRFAGNLRFYYFGLIYTIEEVRQELAERRKNDN